MLLYGARDFTRLPDGVIEKLQSQVRASGKQHSFQIQVAADPAVLPVPLSVSHGHAGRSSQWNRSVTSTH